MAWYVKSTNELWTGKTHEFQGWTWSGATKTADSMKLVEVCLALEDLADEHGFEFDWTSEAAMTKSRSMFRSVAALAEEFANQSEI